MLNIWHRCLLPGTAFDTSSTMFALTFEEDNLVVAGSLVDCVQAVQVERQAPSETVDLSRLEGDQVLIASQCLQKYLPGGTDWTLLNHTQPTFAGG